MLAGLRVYRGKQSDSHRELLRQHSQEHVGEHRHRVPDLQLGGLRKPDPLRPAEQSHGPDL